MTVIVVDVVVKSGSEVSESATCADRQQNVLSGSRAARYISLAYECLLKRKPYQREGPLMREVRKATWGQGRGGEGRDRCSPRGQCFIKCNGFYHALCPLHTQMAT